MRLAVVSSGEKAVWFSYKVLGCGPRPSYLKLNLWQQPELLVLLQDLPRLLSFPFLLWGVQEVWGLFWRDQLLSVA